MSITGVKLSQSLDTLLNEVHHGIFENFRKHIQENNITALNISAMYIEKDYKNLAIALQATPVISVDLAFNEMTFGDAVAFVENFRDTKITSLDLSYNHLGPLDAVNFVKHLAGTSVKKINLDENGINAQGAVDLAKHLRDTNIERISLRSNTIYFVPAIIDFVRSLQDTYITHLNIAGTLSNFRNVGFDDIAKNIHGTKITSFDISYNHLGPLGAVNFVKHLVGTKVKKINLTGNNIGQQGIADLSRYLKDTNIKSINIGYNNILACGAIAFVNSLKDSYVMKVNIQNNNIDQDNLAALGKSLAGTNVISLNLSNNAIKSEAVTAFAKYLTDTYLMFVSFGEYHSISAEARNLLKETLVKNQRKLIYTPYLALCCRFLPDENRSKHFNLPALADDASTNDKLRYAMGILVNPALPNELALHITSFLPVMQPPFSDNIYSKERKYLNLATRFHGKGMTTLNEADNENPRKVFSL